MARIKQKLTLIALLMAFVCAVTTQSQAHEITPSLVQFSQIDATNYSLDINTNLEALMLGVSGNHKDTDDAPSASRYNQLRSMPHELFEEQATEFTKKLSGQLQFTDEDGLPLIFHFETPSISVTDNSDLSVARESVIHYSVNAEKPITSIRFHWPEEYGNSVFKVNQKGDSIATLWVNSGEQSDTVRLDAVNQDQSLLDYVVIGFEHILPMGLDHILFVIGLYLLSQKISALLWQVTAFTVAHTLTLALATLGIISLSPSIVEPLIAASISFVALENLFHHRITKFRVAIVFLFGLLHGLGFAGVLSEIGLNPSAFIPSLISFNIGVELGQLAVITGMYLAFGWWLGRTSYWENWFRKPLSILIALVGIYWFIDRIFWA
ncbi:HupE/UreJ family protein [Marinobacterium sp. YM272]|uniref:HupE/UreJ family protein n=1 Tax=Marinobacterium sp. YM272 TaxID=3421654 RepID=UPI003D80005F